MRAYNFSAGPAVLPMPVLERTREQLLEFGDTGLGLAEISHRTQAYMDVVESARSGLHRLLGCDDDQVVLFLHGGARTQFFQIPMSFLKGRTASFLDTGVWSKLAIVEAERFGRSEVLFSSREQGYDRVPLPTEVGTPAADAAYLHYTSNNTVAGCQYQYIPDVDVPLVCDMSSDILSRPIDGSRFGLIYGGAQKNLGPSGATFVVVRKSWLEWAEPELPTMLDYRTHVAKDSLYNTPCTFAIYVIHEMLQWIEAEGGLDVIAARNKAQSDKLYAVLDKSSLFRAKVAPHSRSWMNVTFTTDNAELDTRFWQTAATEGLVGLKGHKTLGGLRASLYNAQSDAAVDALASFMTHFEETA